MVATTSAPPTRGTSAIRQEVLDFILVAEALLSPLLPRHTLTENECGLIAEYARACLARASRGLSRSRSGITSRGLSWTKSWVASP